MLLNVLSELPGGSSPHLKHSCDGGAHKEFSDFTGIKGRPLLAPRVKVGLLHGGDGRLLWLAQVLLLAEGHIS